MKGALELQAKHSASKADDNSKRKKEICDALAKTAKKRNKKLSSWYYFINLSNQQLKMEGDMWCSGQDCKETEQKAFIMILFY